MRKLASIQRIESIEEIPGYDRVVLAKTLGWQFVVAKADFELGDYFVYVEYDSIFPKEHPAAHFWAFMEKHKWRVKTIKFKGILSQGVALPIDVINAVGLTYEEMQAKGIINDRGYAILGADVTDILGITKYEPVGEIKLGVGKIYNFPSFIPKTDETRIQSCLSVLEELRGSAALATLKLDGSSATYFVKDEYLDDLRHFGVCSRTVQQVRDFVPDTPTMKTAVNPYWEMADKYNLRAKLLRWPGDDNLSNEFAIQGEVCGPGMDGSGVYKNPLGLTERKFFVFNIYDIKRSKYLHTGFLPEYAELFGLETVPFVYFWPKFEATLEQLLELVKGKYDGTNNHREGFVIRPAVETYSNVLRGRLSFKVINNDYLLQEK